MSVIPFAHTNWHSFGISFLKVFFLFLFSLSLYHSLPFFLSEHHYNWWIIFNQCTIILILINVHIAINVISGSSFKGAPMKF